MIDPMIVKLVHIQCIVAAKTIRVDNAIRSHFVSDDRHERRCLHIRNNLRIDLPASFENAKGNRFASRRSAALVFTDTPKIAFI